MQDYIDIAAKNGVTLLNQGKCQFCGANTKRGIHECIEIFNLGFQGIDFSASKNHIYRFFIVDAHTLQHPEIHGRWNNHFHLTRLHLIFTYKVKWTYESSPKLSNYLNRYKVDRQNEYLIPPEIYKRGKITTSDIIAKYIDAKECKDLIKKWAREVYDIWNDHHSIVDKIAKGFLREAKTHSKP
ncbi:MAG: DUF5946 family protein [Bacteroidota bacterium]